MQLRNLIRSVLPAAVGCGLFPAIAMAESQPATAPVPMGEKTYVLRFSPTAEAVKRLGWLQLKTTWRQKASNPVVFEAEASTSVTLATKDKAIVKDPDASGGKALAFISELVNEIDIVTPGRYQAWYRAWFPVRGSWNHSERMDGGELKNNTDSNNGDDKKWLWVKGPAYTLDKGMHSYEFPSPTAWCGGCRLDKIVLQLDNLPEPTGMGPALDLTEKQFAPSAEIVSNRLNLEEMTAWHLEFEQPENGGKVELFYSHDRGKTWQPLPLAKTFAVTAETKRVTFKVRLTTAPDGRSPQVRNLVLKGTLK